MSIQLAQMANAIPEIFLLVVATLAILVELFLANKCKHVTYVVAQAGIIGALILVLFQIGNYASLAFNGLFISDDVSALLKCFLLIATFFSFYYSRQYITDKQIPSGEFYILGLFSVLGMMVLCSAHSLLSIYLGLELMSLPLYAMIALRRESATASEAAIKYFVMGAIASGIMLYGMSILYGAVGSLDLTEMATRLPSVWASAPLMVSFGIVFLVVSISFKLAVVPFHMWAPDVYEGAPTAVTILISSAPKLAATGMLFRLFVFGMPSVIDQWQSLFMIVSVLSVLVGNLLAVVQTNLKRLFAYSGIGHMGYMLFGLIAGSAEGYSASLYYILIYGLMAVGSFGLLVLMSRLGLEVENIDDLKGLNGRSPWLAAMMLIVLFSMAGVPPMVGFFTKLYVLKALVSAGYVYLPLFGLLCAVIGAYNYIRIVKTMYFEDAVISSSLVIAKSTKVVYSINTLSLVALGLFPNMLVQLCLQAFKL